MTSSKGQQHQSLLTKHHQHHQHKHYSSNANNNSNTRPKRIKDLLRHLPTFLFRFIRLLSFIFFLLPAFIVFVYHYLCCDRVAVYYGLNDINNERRENDEGERQLFSRHYLDVYGSRMINGHYCNTTQQQQQQQKKKKPVLIFVTGGAWIIGYRMWGCLLAHALTPFNILVIIPDYRNFPKVNIKGMVHDVDMSIQWTLDNIEKYGGDNERVVLVGQSAGAHIGGVIVAKKVLDWIADQKRKRRQQSQSSSQQQQDGEEEEEAEEECRHLKSTYSPQQLCGFISTSSPHNLVTMRSVFHRHGLSAAVQKSIFGGDSSSSSNDDDDEMLNDKKLLSTDDNNTISNNDMDVFESWSPYHLVKKCETEFVSLVGINENSNNNCNNERFDIQVQNIFPKLCIIHGTADKTVPVEEAIEFIALLTNLKVSVDSRMYQGWSHTDPILEKPMLGNHLYHRDIYELMCLWTKRSDCCCDDVGGLQQHQLGGSVVYNECMSTSYSSNEDSEHKSDSAAVETFHNTGMTGKIMMEMGGEKNAAPTNNTTSLDDDLPPFDEMHPMLRPICPKSLVEIARVCNPF